MKYLIGLIFLAASFFQVPDQNGWAFRQVACLGFLCAYIAWKLSEKYHASVGACFLITGICGLIQAGNPQFGSEVVSSLMTLLFFSCVALVDEIVC